MDSKIYYRIEDVALLIERFRALDTKDQEWLRELFKGDRAIISCLEILDVIEGKGGRYKAPRGGRPRKLCKKPTEVKVGYR